MPGAGGVQCISVHSFFFMRDRNASGGPGGGGVAYVLHSPLSRDGVTIVTRPGLKSCCPGPGRTQCSSGSCCRLLVNTLNRDLRHQHHRTLNTGWSRFLLLLDPCELWTRTKSFDRIFFNWIKFRITLLYSCKTFLQMVDQWGDLIAGCRWHHLWMAPNWHRLGDAVPRCRGPNIFYQFVFCPRCSALARSREVITTLQISRRHDTEPAHSYQPLELQTKVPKDYANFWFHI